MDTLRYLVQNGDDSPQILTFKTEVPLFRFRKEQTTTLPERIPDGEYKNLKSLEDQLRPQQARFFQLYAQAISDAMLQEVQFLCLQLPVKPANGTYRTQRFYRQAGQKEWMMERTNYAPIWDGAPFFPRIRTDQAEQEIPDSWREALLQAWYQQAGSRKPPFHGSPTEILKAYRENPKHTSSTMAKKLSRAPDTIKNQQKQIGEKIQEMFGVTLPDYGSSAARYWYEMGLTLPDIT